jgi:DNA topoisomerase-1
MPASAKIYFTIKSMSNVDFLSLTEKNKEILLEKVKNALNPLQYNLDNYPDIGIKECNKFSANKSLYYASFYDNEEIIVLQVNNDPKILQCINKIYDKISGSKKYFTVNITKIGRFQISKIEQNDIIITVIPNISFEPVKLGETEIWTTLKQKGPYFKYISKFKFGDIERETPNFLQTKLYLLEDENSSVKKIELNVNIEQYAILFGNELINGKEFGYRPLTDKDNTASQDIIEVSPTSDLEYRNPVTIASILGQKKANRNLTNFLNNFFHGRTIVKGNTKSRVKGFLDYLYEDFPNFTNDVKKKKLNYYNIVWNDVIAKILRNKERNTENKQNLELEKEKQNTALAIQQTYGNCLLNGRITDITSFNAPLAQVFKGRNEKSVDRGLIKPRVLPEDISINANVQLEPPDGYAWKESVKAYNCLTWLWKWIDPITLNWNYAYLPEGSSYIKIEKATNKFDIGRKLNEIADEYKKRLKYEIALLSRVEPDEELEQKLVALYLLTTQAFRIDSDSGEDTSEVVGLCGLKCNNLYLLSLTRDNAVKKAKQLQRNSYIYTTYESDKIVSTEKYWWAFFDFAGKDGVKCYRLAQINQRVWNLLKKFTTDKNSKDEIFDKITASQVNDKLQDTCNVQGVSARSFRTQIASKTMFEKLSKIKISTPASIIKKVGTDSETVKKEIQIDKKIKNIIAKQKKFEFRKANLEIAKILNHKNAITDAKINRWNAKNAEFTEKLNLAKQKLQKAKGNAVIKIKLDILLIKLTQEEHKQVDYDINIYGYTLGTSLKNYIDPRIITSWCQSQNIPLSSNTQNFESSTSYVYTKQQQTCDFAWAINSTPSMNIWKWNFTQAQIINQLCNNKNKEQYLKLFSMLYEDIKKIFLKCCSMLTNSNNTDSRNKVFIDKILLFVNKQ